MLKFIELLSKLKSKLSKVGIVNQKHTIFKFIKTIELRVEWIIKNNLLRPGDKVRSNQPIYSKISEHRTLPLKNIFNHNI